MHPGNQINMIEWPVTPFGRTAHATVPVLAQMEAAWTTAIGHNVLGPFNANDPNTEQVRARFLCPVPHQYVSLCIGRTYTPRAFWTDVIGQIAQNQQLPDCAVLVDWARVASTYGPPNPAGQNTTLLGGGVGALSVPLADESLSARRWMWLCEDLPALGRTGTPLERHLVQQTAAFGLVLERQADEAAAFRQAERADKEFDQVYPHAAIGYQMICEVQTAAELPPLLKILANAKKKDAAMVIQHALDARARMPDSTRVSPVVTPEIVEASYRFTPGSPDVDDITAGFNPFLFLTGSSEAATQARQRTLVYSHLHGGLVAPTLDQIRELISSAPNMANSLTALERCYQGCSTFLDVFLGQDQRAALEFRAFVENFQGLKQELEDEFGAALPTVLPLFQRHTQLTMIRYFNDATIRGALATLP